MKLYAAQTAALIGTVLENRWKIDLLASWLSLAVEYSTFILSRAEKTGDIFTSHRL